MSRTTTSRLFGAGQVAEGLRGVVGKAMKRVAVRHLGAYTAVRHRTRQSTLADRTKTVAIDALDALGTATKAADVRRAYLHLVQFAPLLRHTGAHGVIVAQSSGACLTRGTVKTAISNQRVHLILN